MFKKLWEWFVLGFISSVKWDYLVAILNNGKYWSLTEAELENIRATLKKDHFIILTRRKTHLTTYLIGMFGLFVSGRFGYWAHALMNVEGDDIDSDSDYRLQEATGKGVHFSEFMQVFDCDSAVLMIPKGVTKEEWTIVMGVVIDEIGLSYDPYFNLTDSSKVACVEMILVGIKKLANYETRFPKFLKLIAEEKNLTPDMFYNSGEFKVILEYRH